MGGSGHLEIMHRRVAQSGMVGMIGKVGVDGSFCFCAIAWGGDEVPGGPNGARDKKTCSTASKIVSSSLPVTSPVGCSRVSLGQSDDWAHAFLSLGGEEGPSAQVLANNNNDRYPRPIGLWAVLVAETVGSRVQFHSSHSRVKVRTWIRSSSLPG